MAVTGERHVHERLALQQLVEHAGQVVLVVVPSQTELLRRTAVVLHCHLQKNKQNIIKSYVTWSNHTCSYLQAGTQETLPIRN